MYTLFVGENAKSVLILETIKNNREALRGALAEVKKPSRFNKKKYPKIPCLVKDDITITDMNDIYDSIFFPDEPVEQEIYQPTGDFDEMIKSVGRNLSASKNPMPIDDDLEEVKPVKKKRAKQEEEKPPSPIREKKKKKELWSEEGADIQEFMGLMN
jgi:hypothetical protein